MNETKNKKEGIRISEGGGSGMQETEWEDRSSRIAQLKKPLIFVLMGIVFLGCLYLIFKPSGKGNLEIPGLNNVVPQATDTVLQADKQKAYEQALLEQKDQGKRNSLTSLADYWTENASSEDSSENKAEEETDQGLAPEEANRPLNSYRNAQNTLQSFYQEDRSEANELRKQLNELKEQLAEKENKQPDPTETQLALMEKSYQMAAKYLPSAPVVAETGTGSKNAVSSTVSEAATFSTLFPDRKDPVSLLNREKDRSLPQHFSEDRNNRFVGQSSNTQKAIRSGNSIRAIVQYHKVISIEGTVQLRLLEPASISGYIVPVGTMLSANAKLQQGRLQMKVTSIMLKGMIIPVDLTVYGLDGQQGLTIPYSDEMNALTEIVSNMGQTAGTSITMNSTAGQQIAGDLSRGAIQGISGYFTKKLRTPKVTIKAGHQVYLVSKN